MPARSKLDELPQATRQKIKEDIILGRRSRVAVAKQLGIADTSVMRWIKKVPEEEKLLIIAKHKQDSQLAAVEEAAAIVSDGEDIDNDLRWLLRRLRKSIEACGDDDDKLLELAQMREMRHTLESLAKLRGMFSQKIDVQIDLGSSPQFLLLRQIILRVLDQHPEAKADFLREMNVLKVIEQ